MRFESEGDVGHEYVCLYVNYWCGGRGFNSISFISVGPGHPQVPARHWFVVVMDMSRRSETGSRRKLNPYFRRYSKKQITRDRE